MILALVVSATLGVPQHQQHHGHDPNGAQGAAVMGFSQTETSHHFRLSPEGGAIEVHVHDAANAELRRRVTSHIRDIASEFTAGNFDFSTAVHGEAPPGVDTLKKLRGRVTYTIEESERGSRVVIHTNDADALRAIHEFLRYQIREHKTGDSVNMLR